MIHATFPDYARNAAIIKLIAAHKARCTSSKEAALAEIAKIEARV